MIAVRSGVRRMAKMAKYVAFCVRMAMRLIAVIEISEEYRRMAARIL